MAMVMRLRAAAVVSESRVTCNPSDSADDEAFNK